MIRRLVDQLSGAGRRQVGQTQQVTVDVDLDHEVLGNKDCDWPIIPRMLQGKACVVYSFGVGTDISWDREVIERYGCSVWAFDPTPKARAWIEQAETPRRFTFVPLGIGAEDGVLHFAPPAVEGHVSFSAARGDGTGRDDPAGTVECPVRRLTSLMEDFGHREIDVLKLDVEGTEYEVLDELIASSVRPKQLLVEFHHGMYGYSPADTHRRVIALARAGYRRFYKSRSGREHGYVFEPASPKNGEKREAREGSRAPDRSRRDRGVIYFAFGPTALSEAKLSYKSLRESNPDVPACVFTDDPDNAKEFDHVYSFSRVEQHDIDRFFVQTNRMPSLKVRFLARTPFDRTIHLDCDTYVKGSLDPFFEALNDNHFVLTNMPEIDQASTEGADRPVHQSLRSLTKSSAFSCAVFGYRKARETDELLHAWWTQFVEKTAGPMRTTGNWGHTGGTNEQAILHEMLADGTFVRAQIAKTTLPNTMFNAGMSMWPRLKAEGLWDDCRVIHSHAIRQKIGLTGIDGLPDLPELQRFA